MNAITRFATPNATSQIRADHTHVLAIFHRYRLDGRGSDRRALVDAACLALEVHAMLEEEIFYPAIRALDDDEAKQVDENVDEHGTMRELIARLRATPEDDPSFDEDFMTLMREVMHHVADEETMMLPDAERRLGAQRLDELGAEMTRRRVVLVAPRSGEMLGNMVKAAPATTAAVVAGALVGAALIARRAMASRPY